MKAEWLGGRRGEWIAYLRAVERARASDRGGDGMTLASGLVPFGAVQHGEAVEASRLARALAGAQAARVVSADEVGAVLAVRCPYCGREERHLVVAEEWEPGQALGAECGRGAYRVEVGGRLGPRPHWRDQAGC